MDEGHELGMERDEQRALERCVEMEEGGGKGKI